MRDPFQLPETETSEQLSPDAQNRGMTQPPSVEIPIENLYKSFGSHRVLDGINLEVHRGEMIAVGGASGSGKTTLLRHIIGLDEPDRGRVLLADHEIGGFVPRRSNHTRCRGHGKTPAALGYRVSGQRASARSDGWLQHRFAAI